MPKRVQTFRSGEGLGWHEHNLALFPCTQRFFHPGYAANLVESWIPALDGVEGKLKAGVTVADGGFSHFRRATETPFNRGFEARA